MEQRTFYALSDKEVEQMVKDYLGVTDPYYNLIGDLCSNDSRWQNDTTHIFAVVPNQDWIQPNHDEFIAEVRRRGRVDWEWELEAILDELCEAGKLPTGDYLIEVSW